MEFNIEADRTGARLREGVSVHTLLVGDHDTTAMINGGRVELQRLALTIAAAAGITIRIDGHLDGNEAYSALGGDLRESRQECQRLASQLRRVRDALPGGSRDDAPVAPQVRELVQRYLQAESDYKVSNSAHQLTLNERDRYRATNDRLRAQMRLAGLEPDA